MKQPFTPEGAANVLANLYALPNDELQLEAQAFGHNLKQWLVQHFELNAHQEAYLEQLNAEATTFYAQQGSFCMANRLPIKLEVAPKQATTNGNGKDDQGKIVYTENKATATANDKGEMLAEGALYYHIRY